MIPGSTRPAIIQPGPEHLDTIATLIAQAFMDLPATRWLVPDRNDREAALHAQYRIWAEHALHVGHIDMPADQSAVAVWFDRTQTIAGPPNYQARLEAACGRHTDRFTYLDHLFTAHHPTIPHEHLAFLAVNAGLRGTGRATTLIEHHHTVLDDVGIPAYLEAATHDNISFYQHHGYTTGEPFYLPDGSPFWPMTRAPQVPGSRR